MDFGIGHFADNALLFISSLFSHWLDFLKGSGIVVALGLVERFCLKREIHVRWYAAFLVVLAFFACFQAWLDQHSNAEGRLLENVRLKESLLAKNKELAALRSSRATPDIHPTHGKLQPPLITNDDELKRELVSLRMGVMDWAQRNPVPDGIPGQPQARSDSINKLHKEFHDIFDTRIRIDAEEVNEHGFKEQSTQMEDVLKNGPYSSSFSVGLFCNALAFAASQL